MRCADPGWFRIVFTAVPHVLEEGNLYCLLQGFVFQETVICRINGL
jgi:hypothetical protein